MSFFKNISPHRSESPQQSPAVHVSDRWRMPDGVQIWAAPKLRQPDAQIDEREGPLRVVLLGDYEHMACQLEEAVAILKSVKEAGAKSSREILQSIDHILTAVA